MLVKVAAQGKGVGVAHVKAAADTQLILLASPLSVMCGGCGDVKGIDQAPATRDEWERINCAFHCRCEVGR